MKALHPISEREFTSQVIAFAKLHGWLCAHFRPARTAQGWRTAVQGDGVGWPDIFAVKGPSVVAAELKRSRKEKPRPEQVRWLQAFQGAGIAAFLWAPEDWSEIERVLRGGSGMKE